MNKVILGGMLTANIKDVATSTGTRMCTFSLAVRRRGDKSKMEKDTDFFNCVCFNGPANYILNFCGKGDYVEVIGSIHNSSYKDKEGMDRTTTQVYVDEVDRIRVAKDREGTNNSNNGGNSYSNAYPSNGGDSAGNTGYSMPAFEDDDEELPF